MKTLGVAVIGYGFMGKTHTYAHRTIPFYYDPLPAECHLRVVCSSTPERGAAAQKAGGFARFTTIIDEAVRADDVDIVHVCTPNHLHLPALETAIAAGKHIYVEKPLTATLAEAERVEQLLASYRGVGQVVLHNRFFPATIKARQLVEEGFLGAVTHFRAAYLHAGSVDPDAPVNWKSTAAAGGGVVRDLGSHVLDMVNWLIGPLTAVNCISRIWSPQRPDRQNPGERMTIDAEEAAVMLLRTADGAMGTLEASKIATGAEDELRFEIHGRHGAMRFSLMEPDYLEIYDGKLPDGDLGGRHGWQRIASVHRYPAPGGKFPSPKATVGWLRGHVHCLFSFLQAVAQNRPAQPSLADGVHLQRMLEAVLESARSGGWVDLPRAK
jgi:predicted dehydrogenase